MTIGHWDHVWTRRQADEVSWFQARPTLSLQMIRSVAGPEARIVDVGGGASRLVDHLLDAGYRELTVVDIAAASMDAARQRLGAASDQVSWIVADATEFRSARSFDVWHDRAVFHFLVDATDRERYLAAMGDALAVGGHVVLATFGPDGPETCSGLPVRRYSIEAMQATLGSSFGLVAHDVESHVTPSGATQQFVYGLFRRSAA